MPCEATRVVGLLWHDLGVQTGANEGRVSAPTRPADWVPSVRLGAAPSGSFGCHDIEYNYLASYTPSWDDEAQVPCLYNPDTGIMISYEDPESLTAKANYMLSNQLGGIMIWELAADDDQDTLVNTIAAALA